jgi:hypothetical protein
VLKWNTLTLQEQHVWAAAYALAHALETDKHREGMSYRIDRVFYERCEKVADDCVRDLRALNATGERYT